LQFIRAEHGLRWFVIDAIPVSNVDLNGLYALRDLRAALRSRGITLVVAGRRTEFLNWLHKVGLHQPEHDSLFFPTPRRALKAYQRETRQIVTDEE
jgi:MFS superfamily sulfate permease-like transporter